MATEEDRSLRSGMSLPMWMRGRGRMQSKLDFDQSTFSPPENDDSFLYIRYPVKEPAEVLSDAQTVRVDDSGAIRYDISRHTKPCKDYILGRTLPGKAQVVANGNGVLKSSGTDDGFKSEASACGTSVIKVASMMVAGKVAQGVDEEEEDMERMQAMGFDPRLRRGSRSLPASPLQSPGTSPKSRRRLGNKYFTSAAYADDKKPGSILANLLTKRDFSRSVLSITEEQGVPTTSDAHQLNLDPACTPDAKIITAMPKPSHLREMNFWSPTSM